MEKLCQKTTTINSGKRGYRFKQAHQKAQERRCQASRLRGKIDLEMIALIEGKLALQWSPEQIAGWLKKQGYSQAVSYETIYQHIWRDKGAIVSMVERASKLTKLALVPRKRANDVTDALLTKLAPLQDFVLTMTADNGKEFASHATVSGNLKAEFFFAQPYHSWERGLNEHTNGLVRQYFPKVMMFEEITQAELDEVEKLLNNRPRKMLGCSTPIEVFTKLSRQPPNVALQT